MKNYKRGDVVEEFTKSVNVESDNAMCNGEMEYLGDPAGGMGDIMDELLCGDTFIVYTGL